MWQCLPVKKVIVRIVLFSLLIALISSTQSAVRAQSNIGPNTVTNIKEDRSRSTVVIVTSGKAALPRPIIQFLPGENGNTVLVADFPGVVFPFPTRAISVNASPLAVHATASSAGSRGIRLVRLGCFQESPPVFRVAVVANDAAKLRSVTFDSRPGTLVVRWSKSASSAIGMPPLAPSLQNRTAHRRAYQTTFTPPAVTPPTGEMDPASLPVPQQGQIYPTQIDPEIAAAYYPLRPPIQPTAIAHDSTPPAKATRTPPTELVARAQSLKGAAKPAPDRRLAPAKNVSNLAERNVSPTSDAKTVSTAPARNVSPADAKSVSLAGARNVSNSSATGGSDLLAKNDPASEGGIIKNLFNKVKEKAHSMLSQEDDESQANSDTTSSSAESKASELKKSDQPQDTQSGLASSQPPATGQAGEPPSIVLSQNSGGSYTLKIVSPDKSDLNFNSFRLHDPARFVIDFDNLKCMQQASVPQPDNQDMLKTIRVGVPDPLKNTGRLVLDLTGDNVSVIPGDTESVNTVSFVISQVTDPLVGLSPPPDSTLVIDAGHGGTDPGAQRGYLKEKDLTLAIAQKTRDILRTSGVKVVMTRDEDSSVALAERVAITNNLKPDAFLSVHINSLESTSDIHGIETYYQTDMSKTFAQNIHEALVDELKVPDRAIRRAKFYVVNRAEVPAVLAEVGFISNKSEREKLASADYQEKIAGALAKGAILYLKQHSAVAGKVSSSAEPHEGSKGNSIRSVPSELSARTPLTIKGATNIPSASRLVHKGLGIKSH